MIHVNKLSRHYGEFKAVDAVSFAIQRGEIVGLLGHNGAGKTTIMKMITGFLEPTAGTIVIDGMELGSHAGKIQQQIGYLPENCPLWHELTVIDYLEYQAALHGIPAGEQRAAVVRAIRRTALKEKADHLIGTLSRGYRQRVGVAQAILHDPHIIILDEPTNGLDPTQINEMRALIKELAESATVILSTHILQEVQAVCDRVLIMRSAQLVVDSRLEDLQTGSRLLVSLKNDAATSYLEAIEGVYSVQQGPTDTAGMISYLVDAAPETAPEIAGAVHAAGDRLFGLQPETRTLETVFAEVNAAGIPTGEEKDHA